MGLKNFGLKKLGLKNIIYLELTLLFMSLATNITFIWFFSSVHSHMDIECAWRPPVTATYRTADWRFRHLLLIGCWLLWCKCDQWIITCTWNCSIWRLGRCFWRFIFVFWYLKAWGLGSLKTNSTTSVEIWRFLDLR